MKPIPEMTTEELAGAVVDAKMAYDLSNPPIYTLPPPEMTAAQHVEQGRLWARYDVLNQAMQNRLRMEARAEFGLEGQ